MGANDLHWCYSGVFTAYPAYCIFGEHCFFALCLITKRWIGLGAQVTHASFGLRSIPASLIIHSCVYIYTVVA